MKKILIIIFLLGTTLAYSQVKVIKFPELKNYIEASSDKKIKVINFWATWCGPCVKELPFFDSLRYSHDPQQVDVVLVSLDFADQLERVNRFLDRKKIGSKVWLLDETDANSFIDKVDPKWSGAIPATLLINSTTGERIFLEKELTKEELIQQIKTLSD